MRFRLAAATGAALAVFSTLGLGCTATVTTNDGPPSPIAPPAGCTTNSSLSCPGGGDGWSCAANDNPENEVSGLSCSVPQPDGANDDFCCIAWTSTSTTCTPDDSIVCPTAPSYGYRCQSINDDPTSLDSQLNCSAGVADPDGTDTDFCCQ